MNGTEYFSLIYGQGEDAYRSIPPVVKYSDHDNIPQQGPAVTPVAANMISKDYILSDNEASTARPGYVNLKWMAIPVDYEVPVGSVASIVMTFIPGYNYNLGDTIHKLYGYYLKDDTTKWEQEDIINNIFSIGVIANDDYEDFDDRGEGYNTRLMEDKYLRYDNDSNTLKNNPWNPSKHQMYLPWYSAIPFAEMYISIDNDYWSMPSVKELDAVVSKIYPNPTKDQVRIELLNGGAAELRIMNTLGQVVQIAALNEMTNTIDISSLHSGVYVLRVLQGGSVSTTKMIKR
jgi:hypothetical protein